MTGVFGLGFISSDEHPGCTVVGLSFLSNFFIVSVSKSLMAEDMSKKKKKKIKKRCWF